MKINAIFAVGRNGEMGNVDGSLPWRTTAPDGTQIIRDDLPPKVIAEVKSDMENFKRLTTGNIVIMGYNTYKTFSAPLPNRVNIVIDKRYDKDVTPQSDGWLFASTLKSAIALAEKIASESKNENSPQKKIFIIGGAKVLCEAFEHKFITGNVYKTIINADFPDATVCFTL